MNRLESKKAMRHQIHSGAGKECYLHVCSHIRYINCSRFHLGGDNLNFLKCPSDNQNEYKADAKMKIYDAAWLE